VAQPVSSLQPEPSAAASAAAAAVPPPPPPAVDGRPRPTHVAAADDEIDNVNEGHNNFVVLTSSPGSAAHRQTQASSTSTADFAPARVRNSDYDDVSVRW